MAEKYNRSQAALVPAWLQPLFGYQTLSDIHLMRHRIRFRTYKASYDWQPFIDFAKATLASSQWGPIAWADLDLGEPRRVYAAPQPYDSLLVVEGHRQSRAYRFIARLFDIEGVIEVKGKGPELTIKKSPLYSWEEIEAGYPAGFGAQAGTT